MAPLPPLAPAEFAAFFRAIHNYDPFPWQARLLDAVAAGAGWPPLLDLPTGAGKTAAIDVAVFHLALQADRDAAARTAPMRIFFIVDRRLVVDDAHGRAVTIAEALAEPEADVVDRVAARLRALSADDSPLQVARLRGGMPRETDWARSPAQPLVVTSTVDQVGSRLCFRGYGVSDRMKPVHAGLVGTDALYLLDEVHLSKPFEQTLDGLGRLAGPPWVEAPLALPRRVVRMSATPGAEGRAFALDDADRADTLLSRRLTAAKPATLQKARHGHDAVKPLAAEFAEAALALAGGDRRVIAVVVNRVSLARAILEQLEKRAAAGADGDPAFDVALLTGRSRPLDRDEIRKQFLPRMRARADGERESPDERPLFVVATQTIEAGADLDFDALVSEAAPLDALRQRAGRLNRTGRPVDARAVIVAPKGSIAKTADDPLYGRAVAATWAYLDGLDAPLDLGIAAFEAAAAAAPAETRSPARDAPVLLPAYLDAWSMTAPVPAADPDVALFLHGPERPADVHIVWRADLTERMMIRRDGSLAIDRVKALPPSPLEAVSVPIWEARRWLANAATGAFADVDGAPGEAGEAGGRRRCLRWRGRDSDKTQVLPVPNDPEEEIRPGDTIVVPTAYGGCDRWGWNPASPLAVHDVAETAALRQRNRLVLRVSEAAYVEACRREPDSGPFVGPTRIAEILGEHEIAWPLIGALGELDPIPSAWGDALEQFDRRTRLDGDPKRGWAVLSRKLPRPDPDERKRAAAKTFPPQESATEDDPRGSFDYRAEILLDRHCVDVTKEVCTLAKTLHLPAALSEDLALAGSLHDLGKGEARFQHLLHGDDPLLAGGAVIAKSRAAAGDYRAACRRARLPEGARHEAWSVHMARAEHGDRLEQAADPDLVLWLIGTHHGYGRPFFPPVAYPEPDKTPDGEPPVYRIDSGWADLFARLRRRYGAHDLAFLETTLRLADHRVSARDDEASGS